MKTGSVVPAAAEGSNSHLHPAHTTHQQMPAAALFPPNVEAALVTISSIQLCPQPRRSSSKNLGAGSRVFGSMEGRRGRGEAGLLAAA